MKNLCKKLILLMVIVSSVCALEKEAPKGLLQATERKIALSIIGNSWIYQQKPRTVQDEQALNWIKGDISTFQADLIARAYDATQAGDTFIMHTVIDCDALNATDDMYIWLTIPEYVRDYLVGHLNIEFCE